MRAIWISVLVLFGPSNQAQAEQVCLDLSWKGPRGELCYRPMGDPAKAYRLRMKLAKRNLVGISKALSPDTLTISEFQYGMLAQTLVLGKATDRRSRSFLH